MRSFTPALKLGFLLAVLMLTGACTSDSGQPTESTVPVGSSAVTQPEPGESIPSEGATSAAAGPLGFAKDVYDVAVPEVDPETGILEVVDSEDLLDLGVEEGVWDEAEGVRAIISVLMGELPLEAVPDLADLPHKTHSHILDHAEDLMADRSIGADVRADLARLTAFFFADERSQPEAGARLLQVSYQVGCPAGSVTLTENFNFQAPETAACYHRTETDLGDAIFVPVAVDAVDGGQTAAELAELIELARTGYLDLAGSSMPEVQILVSTALSAANDEGQAIGILNGASCRVTVFNTPNNIQRAGNFRHTVAHELFHCVQNGWESGGPGDTFTLEGGAEYFAYRLLGECVSGLTAYGAGLDSSTTNGSLLDVGYGGWYFWAYLDEHDHLSSQGISALHQSIGAGLSLERALSGQFANLSNVLNEFYVRLMGPRLACDLQGTHLSNEEDVDDVKTVELDAELWVGTRYRLNYDKKKLFEQTDPGGGPMGMAPEDSRSSKDEWVVMAEEVRSTCSEKEPMIVVVTSSGSAPETRKIDVDEVTEGVCDPCLIGQWSVDMDTLETFYEASPGALDMELDGSVRFEMKGAPDAATAEVTDARAFSMTVQGQKLNRDGSGTAQYSGDEQFLSISDYVEDGIVSIFDSSSPFAGLQEGGGEAAYTCDGDDLTVTRPEGASFTAVRDPAIPKGEPYPFRG